MISSTSHFRAKEQGVRHQLPYRLQSVLLRLQPVETSVHWPQHFQKIKMPAGDCLWTQDMFPPTVEMECDNFTSLSSIPTAPPLLYFSSNKSSRKELQWSTCVTSFTHKWNGTALYACSPETSAKAAALFSRRGQETEPFIFSRQIISFVLWKQELLFHVFHSKEKFLTKLKKKKPLLVATP